MTTILIVDDNKENLYMIDVLLQKNGFEIDSACNGKEALEKARMTPPDMIVTDILMPVMDGFTLCREWKADEKLGRIPFVFYTATYTDQKDIELGLSLGADRFLMKPMDPKALLETLIEVFTENKRKKPEQTDYTKEEIDVLKQYNEVLFHKLQDKITDLETSNLTLQREIEKRRLTEINLRQSEKRLMSVLGSLPVGLAWGDATDRIEYVNAKFTELFGYVVDEIPTINDWFSQACPDHKRREQLNSIWDKEMEMARQTGMPTRPFDVHIVCKDGTFRYVSVIGAIISTFHIAVFTDITEKKKLQEQLTRSQKLESIGNLAGGIAHDFNNILTVVTGLAGLLQMRMQSSDPLIRYVNEIASAGMRGASLTQQLLAFSRKQILDIRPVDLNEITANLQKMLLRLIREDINLSFMPFPASLPIMADPNQIEQVIINIVTNARDAMPDGGPISISTNIIYVDETFIGQHEDAESGNYAIISIRDKGTGIDEKTKRRIFDPFFTTKEMGKGTGLGLAVVYGIIHQHNGMIYVESEFGNGAEFTVYLPLIKGEVQIEKRTLTNNSCKGGSETILLAEDNPAIMDMASEVLKRYGYNVIAARDGEIALNLFMENSGKIDVVILDLMMPRKKGFDVYLDMIKKAPQIKVLFITGYSENEVERYEIKRMALPLMLKPFTIADLVKNVREALDKGPIKNS
jgi:two-component system, cell cycle sensor histidine kinase and response regulator CckA